MAIWAVIPVTPCVGVWIEIMRIKIVCQRKIVTPCVGVWIEMIILSLDIISSNESLPAWECGLK